MNETDVEVLAWQGICWGNCLASHQPVRCVSSVSWEFHSALTAGGDSGPIQESGTGKCCYLPGGRDYRACSILLRFLSFQMWAFLKLSSVGQSLRFRAGLAEKTVYRKLPSWWCSNKLGMKLEWMLCLPAETNCAGFY